MQIGKAGVVAAGALATVAVMGSAATAAPAAGPAHADPVRTAATTLKQAAVQQAAGQALAAVKTVKDVARGPQREVRQPLISIANGSALTTGAWQACGSASAQVVSAAVALRSPNTVLGDCANGNVLIRQNQVQGVISILDDTSVNALPIQVCGSNAAIAGVTAAIASPATVVGDCSNANTFIAAPKDSAQEGPQSLVSLLSGSVVNAAAVQVCGSTASIAGVAAAVQSPTTVLGDCYNSNSTIQKRKNPAVLPLFSNQVLDILPLQTCASSGLLGQLGPAVPINSSAFVAGQCVSGGQKILD
ncbi:hypothetical protein ACFQZ4_17655 [Catellatospora coxensis]|uniref:Secreted protein n=1 Tax=Catellatospora coxensis TaxID=310354 RepID=A0A8J3KS43_9ACTN|nr:hypothetical protein [Catellatospora coxensis]GIG06140.1 hypothetical protein Cco03nite_28400 [Catellatospora coxensis]